MSFRDGGKYNYSKAEQQRLREASDRLCREYGLSVIEGPHKAPSRPVWLDEKNGKPTRYNVYRADVREAWTSAAHPTILTIIIFFSDPIVNIALWIISCAIGLRDEALLDSALENAFAGFDGQEFYPTKEEKGARLGYTLISNHAFVDGNKLIGMYVMLTFLEVNGIHMECTNEEVVEVGLSVASGTMDYDSLLQWVRDHRS